MSSTNKRANDSEDSEEYEHEIITKRLTMDGQLEDLRLKYYNFEEDSDASNEISFDPLTSVFKNRLSYNDQRADEAHYKKRWNMLKEAINDVKDLECIFYFKITSWIWLLVILMFSS